MSLDRQAIEKRDFPISRRGYETLAVDAHLAQLAREVEALQAERLTSSDPAPAAALPSLASSASEQVRSIVQAAERSAAEIEADLRRTREELTRTVDEISDRLDPRRQAQAAADKGRAFVEDVRAGEPRAVQIAGGALAAIAGLVGIAILRRSR